MAYVVARANGRFEIRESIHTPNGPRARSLANFELLSDAVLAKAASRATRPFDALAVLAAADRVGAPITPNARHASIPAEWNAPKAGHGSEGVRRTNTRTKSGRSKRDQVEPGEVLMELLHYVDQISPFRDDDSAEPFLFPPLASLVAKRRSTKDKVQR